MNITAETLYDYRVYKDFFLFSLNRGKYYRYKRVLFTALAGCMLCVSVLLLLFQGSDARIWFLFVLSLFASFYYLFAFLVSPKLSYRSAKSFANVQNEYAFGEKEFSVVTHGAEHTNKVRVKYSAMHRVYELQQYFYFYITPTQASILKKSGISEGTAEQLREMLRRHLTTKQYIRCK